MENITANLASGVRREVRDGREFLVSPVTLIVPGVLNGSQGALFYPLDEIQKNPSAWNDTPITLGHPSKGGKQVSAKLADPTVRNLGRLRNATVNGKLRSEAWIDVELARNADDRILPGILRGEKIEVSTGLETDKENAEEGANHEGTPYAKVARNYRPDHLALLLDQKGACSVDDGCGLNVNELRGGPVMDEAQRKTIVDYLVNSCCWEEADRATLNSLPEDNLKRLRMQSESEGTKDLALNSARLAAGIDPKLTVNALPEAFKKAAEKAGDSKEEETDEEKKKREEEENMKAKNKKTENAPPKWEDIAPAGIKEDLAFARSVRAERSTAIVNRLTKDVSPERITAQTEVYNAMSLSQLQVIDPGEPESQTGLLDWTGNVGADTPTPVDNSSKLKPMASPTINYNELSPLGTKTE